jgi:hypothetical protein
MSDSINVYKLDPLKGAENYAVWKIKMTDILTDQGLLEYADGTSTPPADSAPTAAAWKSKDRKALSMIRLRVGDGPLVYIAGAKTSKEAWTALKDMFEARGPIGIITVRRKLFRAQCEEGGDIEEHIRTLRGYVEELAGLGSKISDEDFSITLLTSLPDSWDPFISAVDTATLNESHKLIARVLEEDRRIRARNGGDTALAVKYNPNITCFTCNEKGHIALHCPKRNSGGRNKGNPGNGKKNHEGGNWRRGRDDSPEPDEAHQASDDYAFPADPTSQPDPAIRKLARNAMLADSAATSHVFRDRSCFVSYVATPGQRVRGFGGTPCIGKGTVRIICKVGGKSVPILLKDVMHAPKSPHNLVSIGRITDAGFALRFEGEHVRVYTPDNAKEILRGRKVGRLYELDAHVDLPDVVLAAKDYSARGQRQKGAFKPRKKARDADTVQSWRSGWKKTIVDDGSKQQRVGTRADGDKIRDKGHLGSEGHFILAPSQLEGESRIIEQATGQDALIDIRARTPSTTAAIEPASSKVRESSQVTGSQPPSDASTRGEHQSVPVVDNAHDVALITTDSDEPPKELHEDSVPVHDTSISKFGTSKFGTYVQDWLLTKSPFSTALPKPAETTKLTKTFRPFFETSLRRFGMTSD